VPRIRIWLFTYIIISILLVGEYYKAKIWKPEKEQNRHHATRLTKTGVDVLNLGLERSRQAPSMGYHVDVEDRLHANRADGQVVLLPPFAVLQAGGN